MDPMGGNVHVHFPLAKLFVNFREKCLEPYF